MSRIYPPHFESFVAPARRRPQLWRLILGLVIAALVYEAWSHASIAAYWYFTATDRAIAFSQTIPDATTPRAMFLLLATFLGMALGVFLSVRLLHKRRATTLFGRAPIVLYDFAVAAGLVAVVYGLGMALWLWRFDAVPNLDPKLWLMLLPLSLIGVAIQTGAEELVFRGYILQQLAARFRSPLIWMLGPSLLFGLAHYDPATTGANLWLVVAATALFGLVAADLTARTGSIGAAWGFHFANNVAALMFIAVKGTMPGLALFVTPYAARDEVMQGLVVTDMLVLGVAWFVVRRALQR